MGNSTQQFSSISLSSNGGVYIGNVQLSSDNSNTININGNLAILSTYDSYSQSTGALIVNGGIGIKGNTYIGGNIYIENKLTTKGTVNINTGNSSSSATTGALQILGGIGVKGNVNISDNLTIENTVNTSIIKFADDSIITSNDIPLDISNIAWNLTDLPYSSIGLIIHNIAISYTGQYQSAIILSNDNFNIWISNDYGITWLTKISLTYFTDIAISESGKYQSVTQNSNKIYTSNDYGQTWNNNNDSPNIPWNSRSIS